jgi:hypothetical protein
MWEWIKEGIRFVAEPSPARAIVFSIIAGSMLTQFIKFQLPDWLTDKDHSRRVRLFSVAVTFAVCVALWPIGDTRSIKFAIAFTAAISAPTLYWLAVKVLYHFWPWLDTTLSARPEEKKP